MNPHPPSSTLACLAYLGAPHQTMQRPYNYAYEPPAGAPWQNYACDQRELRIEDGRTSRASLSVHEGGFALFDAPSPIRDYADPGLIARDYYPAVAELALHASGATRAWVFDHLVRHVAQDTRQLGFGGVGKGQAAAANGCVHNDYSEASGLARLPLVLGDALASAEGRRYAILNIWRPVRGPVLDTPLALCDARTVDARDLAVAEVRYPRRTGLIYLARFSERHRWTYFSGMDVGEALVFKQYDSQHGGVARFTPHAAFRHPDAPHDAPPRISIEARCLVIYDEVKN